MLKNITFVSITHGMKRFRLLLILFGAMVLSIEPMLSQVDPIESPDSLYGLKVDANEAASMKIDLELALYYFLKNADSVSFYVGLLEEALENQYDIRTDAFVHKFKGWLAQEKIETQQALEWAQQGLALFSEMRDYKEMGWMCMNIGTNYFRLGNYPVATEQYLQALGYFQQVEHQRGIADANNGLGRVSYQTGHFQQAESYFEAALLIYEQLDLDLQKPKIYNNLGLVQIEEGDQRQALGYMFQAASGFQQYNDLQRLAIVYGNVAICYDELHMPDSGMYYSELAYTMSKDINDEYGILTGLINLGYFLRLQGNFDSSRHCFDRALILAKDKQLLFYEGAIYKEYADLNYDKRNYKEAFEYHVKSDSIQQVITNDQTEERIEELLFSYKQELREKELLQLRSDQQMQSKQNKILLLVVFLSFAIVLTILFFNTKIRQQKQSLELKNEQLNRYNKELADSEELLKKLSRDKDRLFSIIAHDLRSPIAAVNGFSELLNESYDELDEDSIKEYLEQLMLASHRTMSLLENLLFWARTQMQKIDVNKSHVDISQFIKDSIEPLMSSAERKQLKFEFDFQKRFSLDLDAEMMSVVLRNLVSNAIKFSFPGKAIKITTFETAEFNCISVKDQGTGIHPAIKDKILSDNELHPTSGTSEEPGTGLGLIISKDFTIRNGGTIQVDSTLGKGATFTLCFPL